MTDTLSKEVLTPARKPVTLSIPDKDREKAEENADFLVDVGELRQDQRASYIRGWLNRGFYRC